MSVQEGAEQFGASPLPPALPFDQNRPLYFPVSVAKLVVMSLVTFGLYEIFWFYKNWQLIKLREHSEIRPFWRAFFAIFYCYTLFKHISSTAENSAQGKLDSGLLALGWILFAYFLVRLPDPYWLVSFLSFLFLIPVQNIVNQLNTIHAGATDPNGRFTPWNIVGIVFGVICLLLLTLGLVLPDPTL